MSSDPFNNPFGGGNGAPDPQNPFQIVNEERPVGGAVPSPFETVSDESPFGVAPSVAPKSSIPEPRGGEQRMGESNPFRTVPKPVSREEASARSPIPPSREGGFEMTGMKADSTPVGNLGAAPLGGATEAPKSASPFSAGAAVDPFASAPAPAPVAEPAASAPAAEPVRQASVEAPVARSVVAASPARLPSKPSGGVNMKQLELRAIFGVDRELSRSEMLQKARGLPGILNLANVSGHNLEALETLKSCMDGLGFAPAEAIALTCPDGLIEFVSYGSTALAVLREGDYGPGIRETLIIIARELDRE